MMQLVVWGIYLGIAATIAYSVINGIIQWRARKIYMAQREINIEEERAWAAAHTSAPVRKPQLPVLDAELPIVEVMPVPKPPKNRAKQNGVKPAPVKAKPSAPKGPSKAGAKPKTNGAARPSRPRTPRQPPAS